MKAGIEQSPPTGAEKLHAMGRQSFFELPAGIEADDNRTHSTIGDPDRQFSGHCLESAAADIKNYLHNGG